MVQNKRKNQARLLRLFRKIHRITAICLFLVFLFISITGILLGWKKNSGGLILAKTHQGSSTDLKEWVSLDSLYQNACKILHDSVSPQLSIKLDRIDVRKDKGAVKFIFDNHFWGIQLDGSTGKLLHIERRRSDLIEKIHDGSILDYILGTDGIFKLFFTSIAGIGLLVFTITGFWLWYGPKQMKKKKTLVYPNHPNQDMIDNGKAI
jgi:hypothetical protein